MAGIFFLIGAYLLGAIPFGLLFGRCMGVDVRSSGSGNIGATNVNRLLGKKMGFVTLVADALKAVVPMLVAAWLFAGSSEVEKLVLLSGGAAFLGHLYPVYLKFKGGKGVATALGVFFYLHPVATLICVAVFVVVVFLSGYVSLGSLVASALMPILLFVLQGDGYAVCLAVFIAVFILLKHYENIGRLIAHNENSIKRKKNGA